MPRIAGSKNQSEKRGGLWADRVHSIARFLSSLLGTCLQKYHFQFSKQGIPPRIGYATNASGLYRAPSVLINGVLNLGHANTSEGNSV